MCGVVVVAVNGRPWLGLAAACVGVSLALSSCGGSSTVDQQVVLDYLAEIDSPGDHACVAQFMIDGGVTADQFEAAKAWNGEGTPPSAVSVYRQGRDQCGGSAEEKFEEIESSIENADEGSTTTADSDVDEGSPINDLAITNACISADLAKRWIDLGDPLPDDYIEPITDELEDITDPEAAKLIESIAESARGAGKETAVKDFADWCDAR